MASAILSDVSRPADRRTLAEIDAAEQALRARMREIAAPPEQLKSLQAALRTDANDVTAMRLLARLEWRNGELMTARALLERAVDLAPVYQGARADLAQLLRILREDMQAVAETRRLLADAPENDTYRALHADALLAINDFASGIAIIEQLIQREPANARYRCVHAQALHFAGRREDSVREFRTCLELQPGMGEAWWGLAQLRGKYLTGDDIAAMRKHLANGSQDGPGLLLLQYALGQALEDADDFSGSFAAYENGAARLRDITARKGETYDSARDAEQVRRRIKVFTAPLFASRTTSTSESDGTPIFIVGMPRAGSTLVEQILASHSQVEATMELPILGTITRDLSQSRLPSAPDAFPECVTDLNSAELAELAVRYLTEAACYRKTTRPCFTDKRPANWLDAGLIQLILPHAKIIDIRREPLASCFAMYKHMLADNAGFPYEFGDLARYYTHYVSLIAHYAQVMPGRIHFVSYERLVEDTETEIRRLLDYCGLPFEEACLQFWKTERAIGTPSAEQVRRPIFPEGLRQWQNFGPWLDPLKTALKDAEIEAAAAPQPSGYERALTLAAMSMYDGAIEELREITESLPGHPGAWQKLSELLRLAGEDGEADEAGAAALRCAEEAPRFLSARDTRTLAGLEAAERRLHEQTAGMDREGQMEMLREHLLENPTDAAATHALSRLEWQHDDELTARALLERTLELAPYFHPARAELALMHMRRSSFVQALEQAEILVRQAPGSPDYRAIHSDALQCVGEYPAALAVTEELLREQPHHPRFWFGRGLLLHYVGRRDDSARAFRKCLELSPGMGEAWWGLADLKGAWLTEADIPVMRARAADATEAPSSRMYMYYALGHALERAGDYAASFAAYQQGARLFRGSFLARGEAHDEDQFTRRVAAVKRVFTARTMARKAAPAASPAVTPIFIVGMPRAGSTLLEQILASHSEVEATRELPVVTEIVRDLANSRRALTPDAYPDRLLEMGPGQLAELGERYLREARAYRRTERAYFVDKRPWNWIDAGLIHLMLPHAKIIDIRRGAMAACFSMFKQVLTNGADFTYDLRDLGRYYNIYVGQMEHWKAVMPGRIHFVRYERLVEDTENEIRGLLDYCGLPFEESCLHFWETERSISTPSAEQVRRPIFRDALEQWRNFEPWLGPLKEALSQPARA